MAADRTPFGRLGRGSILSIGDTRFTVTNARIDNNGHNRLSLVESDDYNGRRFTDITEHGLFSGMPVPVRLVRYVAPEAPVGRGRKGKRRSKSLKTKRKRQKKKTRTRRRRKSKSDKKRKFNR